MTRKSHLLLLLGLILLPQAARAQFVQNMDIYFLFGGAPAHSQTVAGLAALPGATLLTNATGYGYQIVRKSAASLWVEFSPLFSSGRIAASGTPGSANLDWNTFTLGVRFMVPVQSRISLYGATGGGAGWFHELYIAGGSNPFLASTSTAHGVFDFGGGVDVRVIRMFSVRGEVRDFVTGTNLSGTAGRHHVVIMGGIAMHF